jgi:enoyl-CoA hydratase/carnithine racemase
MYEHILYDVEEPVATIRFNRPAQLNAFTNRMGGELKHALAEAEQDERVVAIVLTGEGRGFCAGADLKGLQGMGEGKVGAMGPGSAELAEAQPGDPSMAGFQGPYAYMMAIRKPVIAAINGPAAGLGFAIPLFADMRFASDKAIFTTAFSQRGLIAEWGIAWNLPRLVGPAHALDLLLSARRIDAAEACRIGLVNQVLPHDELIPFVTKYVKHLADTVSPASMAVMKRQVWENLERELDPALRESIDLMKQSFDRPDFKEGVQSFLEKRPPKFARIQGRSRGE